MRDWLAHRVRASPDATALVDAETGDRWTFAALDEAVEETAGALATLGVAAGDRVALLSETRPAFVRLVFACQRLGATIVPLNARLAVPELAAQLETAGPVLLVCEDDTAADARDAAGRTPDDLPVVSVDAGGEPASLARERTASVDTADLAFDDPLAVMFTSGTTGSPKAVRLTVGNFLASAVASAFRLGVLPDDRWLCPLSMYHMGGLSIALRSALYGTTVVLRRGRGFDADAVHAALDEYGCTGVSLVPVMVRRLLDAGDLPDSLRFALVGGAPTPPGLVERCDERDVPLYPTYGATETASQVATASPDEAFAHPGTVGRPMLGTDVTVVDDDGEPLPPGEVGELVVSGPTVSPGYDDPDATAAAFGPRGFHTGDVGYLDESGRLFVLNRREDRIVTGGENVDPGRVADVVREHPDVKDAAVLGVEDPEWGERVAALVVPTTDTEGVDAGDLRDHCEGRLAGYEIPRTVVSVGSLPRTASGTVDRSAARDLLRDADG